MLFQSGLNPVGSRPYVPAGVHVLPPDLGKLLDDARNAVGRDTGTVRSCLAQALALLRNGSEAAANLPASLPKRGGFAAWQEQRVTRHIEANLDRQIRVADLAQLARLSVSYFSVAFRQTFGSSLQTFLARRRVERAQMLMLSTDQTLTDIALACGFCDQAHFCRRFRRIAGSTPNAWRRAHLRRPLGEARREYILANTGYPMAAE